MDQIWTYDHPQPKDAGVLELGAEDQMMKR